MSEIHRGDAAAHWDAAYAKGEDRVSGFQQDAGMSLRLISDLNPPVDAAIIDVGGGVVTPRGVAPQPGPYRPHGAGRLAGGP